jgi:UDP-MurNAc hydroxylase
MQLNEHQRLAEAGRIRQRNLDHLVAVCDVLQPAYAMPFAGNFVLAGLQWRKNRFLGTTTWDDAARYVERQRPAQKTLVLREGQTFDFATETADGQYAPVDVAEQQRYIEEKLKDVRYPYESQTFNAADEQWLRSALPAARKNLWRVQQQFGFAMDYNVYVRAGAEFFRFSLADDSGEFVQPARGFERPYLSAEMDPRLLLNVVRRDAHWNNVEIGCHIDFFRDPDVYHPDVHVMLSFLQLPVSAA